MSVIELNRDEAILYVRPTVPLAEEDFKALAALADPFIEEHGKLAGIIIDTERFPGWQGFGGMIQHFRFVRDHHKKVEKIALVTDSLIGEVAQNIGGHFVAAEVRHFPAGEVEAAQTWIKEHA